MSSPQRLPQVGHEVVRISRSPDRQPHHAVDDTPSGPFLRRQQLMRGGDRLGREALDAPQTGRDTQQAEATTRAVRGGVLVEDEAEDAADPRISFEKIWGLRTVRRVVDLGDPGDARRGSGPPRSLSRSVPARGRRGCVCCAPGGRRPRCHHLAEVLTPQGDRCEQLGRSDHGAAGEVVRRVRRGTWSWSGRRCPPHAPRGSD